MQNALGDTVSRVQEIYKQMMNQDTQKQLIEMFRSSIKPSNNMRKLFAIKFANSYQSARGSQDLGRCFVLQAECLFYMTVFSLSQANEGAVEFMHDIAMTVQEMLDRSFLPQAALRFYAYIYALVGTPSMQNVQYF